MMGDTDDRQDDAPPIVIAPATVIAPPTLDRSTVPLSPTTTLEEDRSAQAKEAGQELKAAGQRQINLIWELTQMRIAMSVIWTALFAAVILSVGGLYFGNPEVQLAAIVFLFGVANLVTGFYFGRTNHQRSGGVGGDVAGTR
jgi:hypothetical protein